jgi:hypothetical protein
LFSDRLLSSRLGAFLCVFFPSDLELVPSDLLLLPGDFPGDLFRPLRLRALGDRLLSFRCRSFLFRDRLLSSRLGDAFVFPGDLLRPFSRLGCLLPCLGSFRFL